MKTLKMMLVFLAFLVVSGLLQGQVLPQSVDNSAWFPPVRSQEAINNCTQFSLVYYLKSYIWNREFNRDPTLEENQFSHNFVWNQSIGPGDGGAGAEGAFLFMQKQGCASVADFPVNEQTQEIFPNLETREKGLKYRSAALYSVFCAFMGGDSLPVRNFLTSLKDSLANGKCFTIQIPLFIAFFDLTDEHNVYNFYQGTVKDSMRLSHLVTVTGYDDNVKTAQGKGAFRVINSNKELANGKFWLDYNWLFLKGIAFDCSFLKEDFSRQPEMSLDLDISSMISGDDLWAGKYCFVDRLAFLYKWIDYDWDSYLVYPRFAQIQKINSQEPDGRLKYLPENNKVIFTPPHNHDGHRQLLVDLADYIPAKDFKSLEVLIQDPISAEYLDGNGKVIYSYVREAKAKLNEGYIKLLETGQRIPGRVVALSDTTIICKDFYSFPIGYQRTPYQGDDAYISKSTSVIRRFLVTFDIADITSSVEDLFLGDKGHDNGLVLGQNYPNPVRSTTTINFSIVASGPVTLKVYNLSGQEVATLVDNNLFSGDHQINFDASRLSEGIYVYTLKSRNAISSKRMLVNQR